MHSSVAAVRGQGKGVIYPGKGAPNEGDVVFFATGNIQTLCELC